MYKYAVEHVKLRFASTSGTWYWCSTFGTFLHTHNVSLNLRPTLDIAFYGANPISNDTISVRVVDVELEVLDVAEDRDRNLVQSLDGECTSLIQPSVFGLPDLAPQLSGAPMFFFTVGALNPANFKTVRLQSGVGQYLKDDVTIRLHKVLGVRAPEKKVVVALQASTITDTGAIPDKLGAELVSCIW